MKKIVAYVKVRNAGDRLARAQFELESSLHVLGLDAMPFESGRKLVEFGELLSHARSVCSSEAFVWCNSDVILTRDPFCVVKTEEVHGFHRREVPSGLIANGVDMYYIPVKWWDDYLSKDVPKLFLGASYVDWWISRAMAKVGAYKNLEGYIDHLSHSLSPASGSDSNPYYQRNFKAYNAWARRNGFERIPSPPFLVPGVGHVWGVRDLIKRVKNAK